LVDKNGRIKVADFGLSRLLQDDEEYFSQTKVFPVRWWAVEALSKGLLDFQQCYISRNLKMRANLPHLQIAGYMTLL
jgi:hypothetical protein